MIGQQAGSYTATAIAQVGVPSLLVHDDDLAALPRECASSRSGRSSHHEGVARDGVVAVGGRRSRRPPAFSPTRRSPPRATRSSASRRTSSSGKLIPAGTGISRYRNIRVEPTEEARQQVYANAWTDDGDYAFGTGSGQAIPLDDYGYDRDFR